MKRILKIIIFIVIFILIFIAANKLYNPVGNMDGWYQSNGIQDLYRQEKNTIDILYVGNSSVYAGISPMEIYNSIGVTGFSCSSPSQKVWVSYYFIKEALKTQKPKVIFLETGEFFSGRDTQNDMTIRRSIDPLELSINKIEMINDKIYNFSEYDKLECIFPIFRYHSRWSEINEFDIRKFVINDEYTYKGYILDKNIKKFTNKKTSNKTTYQNQKLNLPMSDIFPNEVEEKLIKIEQLCKELNCELVFISMPSPKTWAIDQHNRILEYTTNKNIKFIDLNMDDNINMDWDKDSSDSGDHLNIYGAEKVGNYLTKYINNNWNLENHSSDAKYNNWNLKLDEYNQKKIDKKININENSNKNE